MRNNVVFAVLVSAASLFAAEWDFYEPELAPAPKEAAWKKDVCVRLDETLAVTVETRDDVDAAAAWFGGKLKAAFGVAPKIKALRSAGGAKFDPEEYALSAQPGALVVKAAGLAGVKHAFHTLRQIAIVDRGGVMSRGWIMPAFEIRDKPSIAFRGVHLCWFPEQRVARIEGAIRLAAYYKFNYIVLENWGVWRSEKHPWFGWPDGKMTSAEVKRLVKIAADEGVTLVPQLNVFGHASLSRVRTGNHATLDFAPEYAPLFEPYGGWNWCLSNPAARRTIKELAIELHDLFGRPPYFHIGCDEGCPPTCPKCRAADYNQLFSSLVKELADEFDTRGAGVMMWHDMLLKRADANEGARFEGFYCNGDERAEQLLDSLPRSVAICDWYYGSARKDGKYPTLDYFKAKGFRTITSPACEPSGITAQAKYAREHGMFGFLVTTWAGFHGRNVPATMLNAAHAAWGGAYPGPKLHQDIYSPCNEHWRQIGWDMGNTDRRNTGFFDEQFPSTTVTW